MHTFIFTVKPGGELYSDQGRACHAPVPMHLDSTAEMKISADMSSYSLGAVLLQENRGEWIPS